MTNFKHIKSEDLPNGWSVSYLEDLVTYNLGRTPPRNEKRFWDNGVYPWVSIADMSPYGTVLDTKEKVSEEAHSMLYRGRLVPKGTLLMSFKLTIGRMAKLGIPAYHNEAIISIYSKAQSILFDDYLFYYLSQIDYSQYQDTAVKGMTLNKGKINKLEVALPPLPEQRHIAYVLNTIQTAIEQHTRLIALTREFKSTLMHKLFTEGLRGEKQKETEIGLVPESWAVTEVGKVCKSIVPGRNKPKEFSGDIPWVTTPDIKGITYITPNVTENFVSRKHLKESGGKTVPRDSVIMTCVGEFGIVAIAQTEIVINQQLHAFVCPEFLDPFFLCNTLRLRKSYMEQIAHITTLPYLNKSKCESVLVAIPNMEEQLKISEMIKVVEQKIELHIQKKQALEELFRTLLHQLMTGQIRVNDLDVET